MDVYSVTLGLAMLAAIAALGLSLLGRWDGARRASGRLALLALSFLVLSSVHHVWVGHPPGSSSALGWAAFLEEHPALWVTTSVAVAALVLRRITWPVNSA